MSWRWVVSKHATLFYLHANDCAAFSNWYVLVVWGVVVALCTFCDALTSPVNICSKRAFLWFGIIMIGCQASPHHACIIMHALHIGSCLYEKVRHRGAAGVSTSARVD